MRYHIVTLGCPKNTTDSARISRSLEAAGHRSTAQRADADLVVLNTCGFIDDAKAESAQAAALLAGERSGDQRLFVTGCWSEIERERAASVVGVDEIFGIEAWDEISGAAGPIDVTAERDIPCGRRWTGGATVGVSEDLRRLRATLHLLQHPADQGPAVSLGDAR